MGALSEKDPELRGDAGARRDVDGLAPERGSARASWSSPTCGKTARTFEPVLLSTENEGGRLGSSKGDSVRTSSVNDSENSAFLRSGFSRALNKATFAIRLAGQDVSIAPPEAVDELPTALVELIDAVYGSLVIPLIACKPMRAYRRLGGWRRRFRMRRSKEERAGYRDKADA
jgi:hypothetical protein